MDDELLTPREAEALIGRPYGWLEQGRRMVAHMEHHYPDQPEKCAEWRARTPAWEKVGNAIRYRRSAVEPFATKRAGANRNGGCGRCCHFQHDQWEKSQPWFDPSKGRCGWAAAGLTLPKDSPHWLRGALRHRVETKGGRTCKAFEPLSNP